MASRAEEKELRRQKRVAQEQAAKERARRKQLVGYATAGVLSAATIGAIVAVVTVGGSGSGSSAGSQSPFGTHYAGLEARRQAANASTMGAPESSIHIHPLLSVYVNGKKVPVPANVGIDPSKPPMEMAGLHTHDGSGTIHDEGMAEGARLGQFFAIWGVPFSSQQLGPYRVTRSEKVRMWVDGKPSRALGSLPLRDGERIVVSYGKNPDLPK
jgi:hypothetical protein